jgi:hypothetical protein
VADLKQRPWQISPGMSSMENEKKDVEELEPENHHFTPRNPMDILAGAAGFRQFEYLSVIH